MSFFGASAPSQSLGTFHIKQGYLGIIKAHKDRFRVPYSVWSLYSLSAYRTVQEHPYTRTNARFLIFHHIVATAARFIWRSKWYKTPRNLRNRKLEPMIRSLLDEKRKNHRIKFDKKRPMRALYRIFKPLLCNYVELRLQLLYVVTLVLVLFQMQIGLRGLQPP